MMAIHPAQIEPINRAFSPTDAERSAALRIVAAFAAAGNPGVVAVDGACWIFRICGRPKTCLRLRNDFRPLHDECSNPQ